MGVLPLPVETLNDQAVRDYGADGDFETPLERDIRLRASKTMTRCRAVERGSAHDVGADDHGRGTYGGAGLTARDVDVEAERIVRVPGGFEGLQPGECSGLEGVAGVGGAIDG